MTTPLRIAIAGLGTVGTGVVRLLAENKELIRTRAGRDIEITAICARDKNRDRGLDLGAYDWVDNPQALATRDDIDVVVELIGGSDEPALALTKTAMQNGKSLVTANKAMLAHHGAALAMMADEHTVMLGFEASVAGGIPAIKAIKDGLSANTIRSVYGILNGTCNYILTEMRRTGHDFVGILKQAQEKGYAEADPTFDIGGIDTAHKICLLAALCFGTHPDFDAISITGIEKINAEDIEFAEDFGYRIKLLGIATKDDHGALSVRVEPCLIDQSRPIAAVDDVYNAVLIQSDFAGRTLLTGRGAGQAPTASAVVADIIDIAKGIKLPVFGVAAKHLNTARNAAPEDIYARYYLRFTVQDKPGTIADISAILRDHNVSIKGLIQRSRDEDGGLVPVVMTTHRSRYGDISACATAIAALPAVSDGDPCVLRITDEV
jgi:homoserine dehydrogenase